MDSFHGPLFTHAHIYLVFYSKFTNNILVFTAVNDLLCMFLNFKTATYMLSIMRIITNGYVQSTSSR